ncbi:hypothetical protein V5O48_019472, partial [Marasmius crinis-equi]
KAAVADLVFTKDVDRLLQNGSMTIPAISPYPISVAQGRHITLESPYDIIVAGLSNFSGNVNIDSDISQWIISEFSPDASSPTLVSMRTDGPNDDYYIFSMDSWQTTEQVLMAKESFRTHLAARYPSLSEPQLLLTFNSSSAPIRSAPAQVIDSHAQKLSSQLNTLTTRIESMEKKHDAHSVIIQSVNRQLEDMSTSVKELSTSVTATSHQVSLMQQQSAIQQQRSFLQIAITERRTM